jgi:hypothetical protein
MIQSVDRRNPVRNVQNIRTTLAASQIKSNKYHCCLTHVADSNLIPVFQGLQGAITARFVAAAHDDPYESHVRGGALGVTHLTFLSLERLELNAAIPRFGPELANSQV